MHNTEIVQMTKCKWERKLPNLKVRTSHKWENLNSLSLHYSSITQWWFIHSWLWIVMAMRFHFFDVRWHQMSCWFLCLSTHQNFPCCGVWQSVRRREVSLEKFCGDDFVIVRNFVAMQSHGVEEMCCAVLKLIRLVMWCLIAQKSALELLKNGTRTKLR